MKKPVRIQAVSVPVTAEDESTSFGTRGDPEPRHYRGRALGREPQQTIYQQCGGGRRVIRKKIGGD